MAFVPDLNNGFESDVLTANGGTYGTVTATASTATTTPRRPGGRYLVVSPTASAAGAVSTPAPNAFTKRVTRFYFRINALPSSALQILGSGLVLNANGTLTASGTALTSFTNTTSAVPVGEWVRLVFWFDGVANSAQYVSIGSGSPEQIAARTATAATSSTLTIGQGTAAGPAATMMYDDVLSGSWTTLGTDSPGHGHSVALLPTSGDLTTGTAGTRFVANATTTAVTTTTLRDLLANVPWTGDTTFVRQTSASGTFDTNYAQLAFTVPADETSAPNFVTARGNHGTATASGQVSRTWAMSGSVISPVHGTASAGAAVTTTVPFLKSGTVTPASSPWTTAQLGAVVMRINATDINPVPYWYGLMLEVDFPESAAAPAAAGTATGTWTFAGAASGVRAPKASAAGTWTFAGAAAGVSSRRATAAGTFTFTGSATGSAPASAPKAGTAAGTWTFAGAAAGVSSRRATAAGTFTFTGSATGSAPASAPKAGTAAGTWTFAGSSTGARPRQVGSGAGTWTFTGSAVGDAPAEDAGPEQFASLPTRFPFVLGTALQPAAPAAGTASGDWQFTGAASGASARRATGAGTWTFTGTAAGVSVRRANAAGTWSWSGTASGSAPVVGAKAGTASGTWSFVGTAAGVRTARATSSGTWTFAGASSGTRTPRATAVGTWTFAGAAAGVSSRRATAAGTFTFTGSASGSAPAVGVKAGTATGAWSFAGSAAGARTARATSTGTWTFAGGSTGTTTRRATSSGTWTFAGTAAGKKTPKASAAAGWSFAGAATGTTVRRATSSGTWTFAGSAVGTRPSTDFIAPTGLTAMPITPFRIDLTWNSVPTAESYGLERNGTVILTGHVGTSYSDTGRDPNTAYTYRVRAEKAGV